MKRSASAPTPSNPSGKARSIRRSNSLRFVGRASSTGRFRSSRVAPEITASGSTPFPLLLLMTAPRSSSTVGWMYTSSYGSRPVISIPAKFIRATQKNRMPLSVERSEVG